MKVVAFNGSARKNGNTSMLVNYVFDELNKEGITTEQVQLAGEQIRGCKACRKCYKNLDKHCSMDNDILNRCIDKMLEADGIILASPVYFSDVTANMKALIERAGYVAGANNAMFKRKVGASIVAVRRGGAIHTFDSINHFFFITQMIVPGSRYWNLGIGREIGEVNNDNEGIETMRVLGQNIAWLLKKLRNI